VQARGVVTLETVSILEAQGAEVQFIALLDTPLVQTKGEDKEVPKNELLRFFEDVCQIDTGTADPLAAKAMILKELISIGIFPAHTDIGLLERFLDNFMRCNQLMRSWRFPQITAPVLYYRATDNTASDLSESLQDLTAGTVHILDVQGRHVRCATRKTAQQSQQISTNFWNPAA
jgi:thioesterase domain-containing protein